MHSLGLVHCDLKPENILIKSYSRCEVKVIDFGSANSFVNLGEFFANLGAFFCYSRRIR